MKTKAKICFFLVLLLMVIVVGAVWFFLGGQSRRRIRNVVLISIDTCRADHLSCYGYPHKTTPNIDAIAEEGILFENVISPVPITLPAHSSMLTGTIPPYHGVHDNDDYRLGQSNLSLAEILKDSAFTTGAVVGAFVLDSQFGLDQGFDTYDDDFDEKLDSIGIAERRGEEVSRHANSWLQKHWRQPFFLFLHYFDPHVTYDPPEPFNTGPFSDIYSLYAGEISYVDYCIGQVIEKLKSLEIYDSTLIIITSDHGESLGAHSEATHCFFIYNGTIKVPLIFKLPGRHQGRQIDDMAGLVDIVPTVCGLLGIKPPDRIQGEDLSRYFVKKRLRKSERDLYCESLTPTKYDCSPLFGLVTSRWKYIQATRPELYDLQNDPGEINNLIDKQPHRVRRMRDQLKRTLETHVYKKESDSKLILDQESRRRLESLGYVSCDNVIEDFGFDQNKDDPKDLIDFHKDNTELITLINRKEYAKAKELGKGLLERRPAFASGHYRMSIIAYLEENLPKAVEYLTEAVKLRPNHPDWHNNLAMVLMKQEKFDEALPYLSRVLYLNPDHVYALNNMANLSFRQGRTDEAVEHWKKSLSAKPAQPDVCSKLGEALTQQGKLSEAIKYYGEVLRVIPEQVTAHNRLAWLLYQSGKTDDAIRHYSESLRLKQNQSKVHNVLAELLYMQGKTEKAIGLWKQALKLKPDIPEVLNNLAWIMATHKEGKFRDADESLQYAQKACKLTGFKNPDLLDTLSAAYAANRQFDKAVETAERALELYRNLEEEKKTDDLQNRLELFRQGQPYREKL